MDKSVRLNEIQLWHETDVLGSMLVNGNMTDALIKDLTPNDFRFKRHRLIYQAMKNLQHYGKFETVGLLTDKEKGRQNLTIIRLMEDCLMTNIKIKCQWILDRSIKGGE
jgi:replicative DNA helicase